MRQSRWLLDFELTFGRYVFIRDVVFDGQDDLVSPSMYHIPPNDLRIIGRTSIGTQIKFLRLQYVT